MRGPARRGPHTAIPADYHSWHGPPGYAPEIGRSLPAGRILLDLGGGTGWLHEHIDATRLYVLGDRETAVAQGRRMGVTHGVALSLSQGLPFGDHRVDVVVMKDVLEHLLEPLPLVRECRRVLGPQGRLYVSVPMPGPAVWDDYTHVRPFTMRGLTRLLEDGGFSVAERRVESVMRGVGYWAKGTGRGRRPKAAHYLARLGIGARNAVAVATPGEFRPGA